MDFSTTGIQSILNESIQHKNVKLIMTVSRAEELINMIESTYGKNPYKKILVDNYGNLVITSDTNKILQSMKLIHPFQFLLKDILSKMDKYGDGNTFLVLLLGKILNKCKDLLAQGMTSFKLVDSLKDLKKRILREMSLTTPYQAYKDIEKCDSSNQSYELAKLTLYQSTLNQNFKCSNKSVDSSFDENTIKTALFSILKDDKLIDLLSESIKRSKFINPDDIRIQKVQSGSLEDSFVINGILLENSIETDIFEKSGKCAIFNTSLDIERSETKGALLFENADDLLNFSKEEDKNIESITDSISENCDIVFFNGNVNERFVEFFNFRNILTVRVISKFDLRRIMRMSNGKLLQNIKKPILEETGQIDSVKTVYFADKKFLQIERNDSNIVTIVLKDSLLSNLNENELLLEKGIKVLDNLVQKDFFFIKGSGQFEKELASFIENEAKDLKCGKRLVFNDIAQSLREFPITKERKEVFDILTTKKHAYESALDIACEVLMIEDYLVGKNDAPSQE